MGGVGLQVVLVRWHPKSAVFVACLYNGDLQFFDLAGQALSRVGDRQSATPTAPMASHLDYIVRPVCADWCRAEPKPGEPPSPADHLAVIFDRGNCANYLCVLWRDLCVVCRG